MISYLASYEDWAKAERAARKRGFTGEDDEVSDFVEFDSYRTTKRCASLDEAVAWLKAEIAEGKTVYGLGDIDRIERTPRRCQYCTCDGEQAVHRYNVDDQGVCEDWALDSQCCDD